MDAMTAQVTPNNQDMVCRELENPHLRMLRFQQEFDAYQPLVMGPLPMERGQEEKYTLQHSTLHFFQTFSPLLAALLLAHHIYVPR